MARQVRTAVESGAHFPVLGQQEARRGKERLVYLMGTTVQSKPVEVPVLEPEQNALLVAGTIARAIVVAEFQPDEKLSAYFHPMGHGILVSPAITLLGRIFGWHHCRSS